MSHKAALSVLRANIDGHEEAAAEACTTATAPCEADAAVGEQYTHSFEQTCLSTSSDGAARHE